MLMATKTMMIPGRSVASLAAIVLCWFAAITTTSFCLATPQDDDEIAFYPGYGAPPTPHFSGYLDASDGCDPINGPVCRTHYVLASLCLGQIFDELNPSHIMFVFILSFFLLTLESFLSFLYF